MSRLQLHALRCVCNRFSFGPICRVDAPAQLGKFRIRKIHLLKRTNSICLLAASLGTGGLSHGILLCVVLDSSVYGPGYYYFCVVSKDELHRWVAKSLLPPGTSCMCKIEQLSKQRLDSGCPRFAV